MTLPGAAPIFTFVRSSSPRRAALAAIEEHGALLVYPIENRAEPRSLWSVLHPRARMRWDWDSSGDDRVVRLWQLREELARSREVVYSKWFRDRATFFSRTLFTAMLATLRARGDLRRGLEPDALDVLRELESDSPLSTKQLRAAAGLTGKMFEAPYKRALKQLFERQLIVGFGEVDDGAFPSLAIGATRTLFEDLWDASSDLDVEQARRTVDRHLAPKTALRAHYDKIVAKLGERAPAD